MTQKKKQSKKLSVVLYDEELREKISVEDNLVVYETLKDKSLADHKNIFVVSKASNLSELSGLIREANKKNHLKALFIRPDVKYEIMPKLMDASNVRSLRNTLIHEDPNLLRRILNAWKTDAQDQLVADASVNNNTLYVVSCSLKMYEIHFEEIPALKKMNENFRNDFTIAEDGRYIHWKHDDIHIDIETLKYHTDKKFQKEADLKRLQYYKNLGKAIKKVREHVGIRQSDIRGMSARHVRRIENGETPVSAKALEKIAFGLNMNLEELLDKIAPGISYGKT